MQLLFKTVFNLTFLTPFEACGICHMNNMALMLLMAVAFLMQSCWELAFELGPSKDPYRPNALKMSSDISSHNVLALNIDPDPAPNCFVPMLCSYRTVKWCNQGLHNRHRRNYHKDWRDCTPPNFLHGGQPSICCDVICHILGPLTPDPCLGNAADHQHGDSVCG
jgi:hypothetical protein